MDRAAHRVVTLTALQQRILTIFAQADHTGTFALAGGGAMNVHRVTTRQTHDLDFFTPAIEHVATVADRLTAALEAQSLTVERLHDSPGFVRLAVGEEQTLVELAHDYRWLEPIKTALGLVLDPRELAGDKLCALFGRAEPRDLLDVEHLRRRFDLADMVQWATEKDGGFDVGVTIEMIVGMARDVDGLNITNEEFHTIQTQLVADLNQLRRRDIEPPTRSPGRDPLS